MILVDTSIWIEFLKRNSPTFEHMLLLLEQGEIVTIEAIFGELLQGAKSKHEREVLLAYWDNVEKVGEDELLIEAGLKSGQEKWWDKGLGLIDAAILIAAKSSSSKIWTLDKKLGIVAGRNSY